MERGQRKTVPGEPTAGRGRFQEDVKARGGPEAEERVARRPATFGSLGERQEGEHTVAQNKAWVSGAAHRAFSSTTAQKDSGSPEREKDIRRTGAAPEAPKDELRHNGGRAAAVPPDGGRGAAHPRSGPALAAPTCASFRSGAHRASRAEAAPSPWQPRPGPARPAPSARRAPWRAPVPPD